MFQITVQVLTITITGVLLSMQVNEVKKDVAKMGKDMMEIDPQMEKGMVRLGFRVGNEITAVEGNIDAKLDQTQHILITAPRPMGRCGVCCGSSK